MATDFVDDWGYGANNGWEDAGDADGVREVSDGANGQGWDCANSGWGDNTPGGNANGSSHGKSVGGVDRRREFSGGGGFRREFSGGADVRRGFSGGVGGRREFSGGADGVREVSDGANGQGWDCANSGWGDNAPGGDANGSSHGQSVGGVDGRRGFSGGGGFRREFSGGADVRRGFSGGVGGRREFSGGADGRRGFSGGGGFRREFSGGAEVRREFSGGVGGRREFSGGDDGRREFSGGADGRRGFSGSADVRRGFSGAVGGRREFSGSANGRRIFSGSANGRREFSGSADARRGFSGGVDVRRGFERSNAGQIQCEIEKPPVPPSKILYVDGIEDKRQNLPLLSVEEITEVFCNHVNINVSVVDIARIKFPKRVNHHALVELGSVEEAHNAIEKLDGMTLGSKHTLSVAFSVCESRVPTNQQLIQMRKIKRSPEGKHDGEEGLSQEGSGEEAIDKENGDQSEKPVAPSSVNEEEMDVYSSCSSGDLPMTSQDFEDEIVAESADESTYDTKENDGGGGVEAKDKENGDQSEMPVAPSSVNEEEIDVYSSCSSGDLPMTSHDLEDEIVGESSDESTNDQEEDGDQTMRAGAVDYYGDDEMPVF